MDIKNAIFRNDASAVKKWIEDGGIVDNDLFTLSLIMSGGKTINVLFDAVIHKPGKENAKLKWAVESNRIESVRILLDNGADPSYVLPIAAGEGNIDIVRLLLSAGADVHNNEALTIASERGHTDIVRLLLAAGANIHIRSDSALRIASTYGHTEIVRLLLRAGANIHASDDDALRRALTRKHIGTINLLLEHGADIRNIHAIHTNNNQIQELIENERSIRSNYTPESFRIFLNRYIKTKSNYVKEILYDFIKKGVSFGDDWTQKEIHELKNIQYDESIANPMGIRGLRGLAQRSIISSGQTLPSDTPPSLFLGPYLKELQSKVTDTNTSALSLWSQAASSSSGNKRMGSSLSSYSKRKR